MNEVEETKEMEAERMMKASVDTDEAELEIDDRCSARWYRMGNVQLLCWRIDRQEALGVGSRRSCWYLITEKEAYDG